MQHLENKQTLNENGIDEVKLPDEEMKEDYNLRRFQIINSTVNS